MSDIRVRLSEICGCEACDECRADATRARSVIDRLVGALEKQRENNERLIKYFEGSNSWKSTMFTNDVQVVDKISSSALAEVTGDK